MMSAGGEPEGPPGVLAGSNPNQTLKPPLTTWSIARGLPVRNSHARFRGFQPKARWNFRRVSGEARLGSRLKERSTTFLDQPASRMAWAYST